MFDMNPSNYIHLLGITRESLERLALEEQALSVGGESRLGTAIPEAKLLEFANKEYIYRNDGFITEKSKASFLERHFTSLSLADYGMSVAALYNHKEFHEHNKYTPENERPINTRSTIQAANNALDPIYQALEKDLSVLPSLQNRISTEIEAIETANKAWGIFSFIRKLFTFCYVSKLEKAFSELDTALTAIESEAQLVNLERPLPPKTLETEGQIGAVIDPLFGDCPEGSKKDLVKKAFIEYLQSPPYLVIYNSKDRIRSFANVDDIARDMLLDIFAGTDLVPHAKTISTVKEKVQAAVKVEIDNFNGKVLDFLLKKHGANKFALIRKEIEDRAKAKNGPITADEIVAFNDRLEAIQIVTYKPANGGLFSRPEGATVYFDALIKTGLGTRLPQGEVEKIAKFLKDCTQADGLIKFPSDDAPIRLVVNGNGSIPMDTLNQIIEHYLTKQNVNGFIAAKSLDQLARELTKSEPRHPKRPEIADLLENLGYTKTLDNTTVEQFKDYLLTGVKEFTVIYYASIHSNLPLDRERRTHQFNQAIYRFLDAHAGTENKDALKARFSEIFFQDPESIGVLTLQTRVCTKEEFRELFDIANKKPEDRGFFRRLF